MGSVPQSPCSTGQAVRHGIAQHADHRIAEALDARIKAELPDDDDDGPAGVVAPVA
ncbi:hypothetical protein NE236_20330 [Actinoallomurus purpureus]|uniref:hypothetical protein n=1 Tax=Actinoallomurus purpureus TaxID=478114 RepID=UPI0020931555|nr:hypothetical protein [Actinoallomurus purpureus]MCO6007331.1 hypothetical protein [Actinoallomurus purpureus]